MKDYNGDIWTFGEDTVHGNSPFYCDKSVKHITIEDGITSLTDKLFFGAIFPGILTVPESIATVGASVCEETNVSVVYYGGAVVGERMFANDDALVYMEIAQKVTKISDNAFLGCVNFLSATYNGTINEWNAIEKSETWAGETGNRSGLEKIQCTDGYLEYDWHTQIWNEVRE